MLLSCTSVFSPGKGSDSGTMTGFAGGLAEAVFAPSFTGAGGLTLVACGTFSFSRLAIKFCTSANGTLSGDSCPKCSSNGRKNKQISCACKASLCFSSLSFRSLFL